MKGRNMGEVGSLGFGELLKVFRKQRQITQHELANRIGVHRNTIGTWEHGDFLPESKTIVLELARQLHLNEQETRQLLEASLTALSPYWLLPYSRNPFFTGREEILQQLHNALTHEHSAIVSQSHALSGLGGIGKTQTAIEYAYRYANNYTAVFWVNAETYESIVSSMVTIAALLNLPEEQEQEKVMAAAIQWLTNRRDWLLILDNVEDPALVKRFLPSARCGSILFTSRRQSLGLDVHTLDLKQMTQEESIYFLLHRLGLLDPGTSPGALLSTDMTVVKEIITAMDGLPLALDQAGAYIEATHCSFSDYLQLYRSSQHSLLDEREAHANHPLSVVKTFTVAFELLKRDNPAAAEVLTVCAFLAPEAIPETVFTEGATHLGPTFEKLAADLFTFHAAIKALLKYSLLQRNRATQTVTIHRLVQLVLKESLEEASKRRWITRVLHMMIRLFPSDTMQIDYWQVSKPLLTHALICIVFADQWNENIPERITLMNSVAIYLTHCVRFSEAEALFQKAVHLGEQALGAEHPLIVEALYWLARLYSEQDRYSEAEPLYRRVLYLSEQAPDVQHPVIAEAFRGLGELYRKQGWYSEAEVLYKQALNIGEAILGPKIASLFNNLAILYSQQGKYKEAEPLFQRALYTLEQALSPDHLEITTPLNNLANLYLEMGEYEESKALAQRVLRIIEQVQGADHPDITYSLGTLGQLYWIQRKHEEAEVFFQHVLQIKEQTFGKNHYETACPLNNLAFLYKEQGRYEEAESFFLSSAQIIQQTLGAEHSQAAEPLCGLAEVFSEQKKYDEAEPLYQRALALRLQHLGPQHPEVAESLHAMAHFRQAQQHIEEALSLYQQALATREQVLGPNHPKTIQTRTDYARFLEEIEKRR